MQTSLLTYPSRTHCLPTTADESRVEPLENSEYTEVLKFLERRPVYTACLAGLIRDNGIQNQRNRGTFFGYRNQQSQLEGVALIGHATLLETTTDQAIEAFAQTTQRCKTVHLMLFEENHFEKFWSSYAFADQQLRRACRQLLLELRWPVEIERLCSLRLATILDLKLLIPIQAEMAITESGVDPRQQDAAGFLERYARRIEQGRTWVVIEAGKLLFKAEVIAETPETSYIEGVWVNPDARSQGYGQRCMSQLARMLLWKSKSICLFVNDDNDDARRFYKKAGYHLRAVYDTIFLK